MPAPLPPLVERFVAAVNGGDSQAFLALFGDESIVTDWGDRYVGIAAISEWNDREMIGAKGTLTVSEVKTRPNEIIFNGDWKSSVFTGPGRFVLHLEGERIREMRISEA